MYILCFHSTKGQTKHSQNILEMLQDNLTQDEARRGDLRQDKVASESLSAQPPREEGGGAQTDNIPAREESSPPVPKTEATSGLAWGPRTRLQNQSILCCTDVAAL